MTSILNQRRVLRLNANWKAYDVVTVQDAFIALSRQRQRHYTEKMKRPYCALHIEYAIVDGQVDYDQPLTYVPVVWKDWIELPVRFYDQYVSTANSRIRVPTVIIANNYKTIPEVKVSYSKRAVWERDGGVCQLTGEKVSKNTGNIEHYIPRSKGGATSFENTYLVQKRINQMKGDMSPEDFFKKYGLKPMKALKAPSRREAVIENTFGIPDWNMFLEKQ